MGTSVAFVAARPAPSTPVRADPVAEVAGWTVYRAASNSGPQALEEAAAQIAADTDGLSAVGYVQDSDFGFVAAATGEGVVARLLFGAESAEVYAEGQEAIQLIEGRGGADPKAFEVWSQLAGSAIPAATIRDWLVEDWTFAEDAVDQVFKALGIDFSWDRL